MKKKIFIGSSTEAKFIAEKIAVILEELEVEPILWTNIFDLGDYTFTSLENIIREVSGAIFIFNEDDKICYRGTETTTIRDNVLFEYGFFAGKLSREQVIFACVDEPKIPSDLLGITYLKIDENKAYTTKTKLQSWVETLTKGTTEVDLKNIDRDLLKLYNNMQKSILELNSQGYRYVDYVVNINVYIEKDRIKHIVEREIKVKVEKDNTNVRLPFSYSAFKPTEVNRDDMFTILEFKVENEYKDIPQIPLNQNNKKDYFDLEYNKYIELNKGLHTITIITRSYTNSDDTIYIQRIPVLCETAKITCKININDYEITKVIGEKIISSFVSDTTGKRVTLNPISDDVFSIYFNGYVYPGEGCCFQCSKK